MTLKPTQKFRYRRAGMCVPLGFADKIPVIPAAADGIAGTFEIDTGSSSALVLQREFVEQHGFEDRHPSVLRMKSSGSTGYSRLSSRVSTASASRNLKSSGPQRNSHQMGKADFR